MKQTIKCKTIVKKNTTLNINIKKLYKNLNRINPSPSKFIDDFYLFNCSFNYTLPNRVEIKQKGKVIILSSKPQTINKSNLKKGYKKLFENLEKEKQASNIYRGFYVEEVNNKYILKHTNY